MGKADHNKLQKKKALLQASFELFIEKGFSKTTLSDITQRAGIAKGTFYLYFKDKYDLRNKLIEYKTSTLFEEALNMIEAEERAASFEDSVLQICDFFVDIFHKDPLLLRFISKNLSWGILKNVFEHSMVHKSESFTDHFIKTMSFYHIKCEEPELMLYSIIEFMESTCYSCILYEQPMPITDYMPYLHRSLRALIHSFISLEE